MSKNRKWSVHDGNDGNGGNYDKITRVLPPPPTHPLTTFVHHKQIITVLNSIGREDCIISWLDEEPIQFRSNLNNCRDRPSIEQIWQIGKLNKCTKERGLSYRNENHLNIFPIVMIIIIIITIIRWPAKPGPTYRCVCVFVIVFV